MKRPKSMLECIQALRESLGTVSQLEVLHEGGYKWMAGFEWHTPATLKEIDHLDKALDTAVPTAYKSFLRLSNGAMLYKDEEFGQWGFWLYSVKDLTSRQAVWHTTLGLPSELLVFCECLGDADLLILDTSQPTPDNLDCAVVYAEEAIPVSDYKVISYSFHEWIDHLIVAQGAKFWRWK